MIRKETQGVKENAVGGEVKNPDETFRFRNGVTLSPTDGKSVRTKGQFGRTAGNAWRARGGVRPLELFFLIGALALGALAPASRCGPEASGAARPTPAADVAAAMPATPAAVPTAPAAVSATTFAASVRPVLLARCAPCHEPGGKMYAKLPFDQPTVVASHSAGVLRRLQGENREAVETWLATLPAAAP